MEGNRRKKQTTSLKDIQRKARRVYSSEQKVQICYGSHEGRTFNGGGLQKIFHCRYSILQITNVTKHTQSSVLKA